MGTTGETGMSLHTMAAAVAAGLLLIGCGSLVGSFPIQDIVDIMLIPNRNKTSNLLAALDHSNFDSIFFSFQR